MKRGAERLKRNMEYGKLRSKPTARKRHFRFFGTDSVAEVISRVAGETNYFFHHDREVIHTMATREFREKTFSL